MGKIYFFLVLTTTLTFETTAQTLQTNWWITDGQVQSIVQSGNTVYLGGTFKYVGPNDPYGMVLDNSTGAPNLTFVKPNGYVLATIPDGSGGWYIGGQFTKVGGQTRNYIARINADGSLNAWDPNADNVVNTLVLSGSTVYAGGNFLNIGGQARISMAALAATTGLATPWNPNINFGSYVLTIAVSGSTVYAGGLFTSIGGQPRNGIAALDATTALATSWDPNPPTGNVNIIVASGSTVYAGGQFTSIGGQLRNNIAALDATSGLATPWDPNAPGSVVKSIAINGSTVYAGGSFSSTIGGQTRNGIAALDATTGLATAWDPGSGVSGSITVNTIALGGSTVYAGGGFTSIGGQARNNIAALSATTGLATSWDPNVGGSNVITIALSGTKVFAGGYFISIGGKTRNNIAALDATTSLPTSWDPNAYPPVVNGGYVKTIAVSGNTVYAGGYFTTIGGQTRNYIAALDSTTGLATSWDPNANGAGDIRTIVVSSNKVYAGGNFTTIGGQTRNRIASLDATTGLATSWDPNANVAVNSIVVGSGTVYAGGLFTSIGGQTRNRIASLDATTGLATSWDPNPNGDVNTIAINGSTVYAGGLFTSIGGQTRNHIASLDATTGLATSWDPNANDAVNTIALRVTTVYAGGVFGIIGGQTRLRIAALDASTGLATSWDPSANSDVNTVTVKGSVVYVSGLFTALNNNPQPYFASFTFGAPLPIHFVSFNAKPRSNGNLWQVTAGWVTASEQNSSHFIVERSSNAKTFLAIGQVVASGNSSAMHTYGFTDYVPLMGASFYRLKEVDLDGMISYSKVIAVSINSKETVAFLYPNPVNVYTTLVIAAPKRESIICAIVDQNGRTVQTKSTTINEGSNALTIETSTLSTGMYTLVVKGMITNKEIKFVKQ